MTNLHTETLNELWDTNKEVYEILRNSDSVETARKKLYDYLINLEKKIYYGEINVHPLERINMKECIKVFKNILAPKNEELSGFSALRLLWLLANEKFSEIDVEVSEGFIEEFKHLFKGIIGNSGIYDGKEEPIFLKLRGREAAIVRSDELDKLAEYAKKFMDRYPSGLLEDVKKKREENKKRILEYFGGDEDDWNDWKWHLKHIIKDSKTLSDLVNLTEEEIKAIDLAVENHIPFGVTPYYASLMDKDASRKYDHAIRAQVIPPLDYVEKMIEAKNNRKNLDFMGESDTSPIDLVTRRYPMIAIVKPYNTCAQICVYCQRNWEIKEVLAKDALAPKSKLEEAIDWFRNHESIKEVLITGGDPFILNDKFLDKILSEFAEMKHIERIRFGTRIPVVLPQRVTDDLAEILEQYHEPGRREIVVSTHVEHVYEVTEDLMNAVQKIRKKGICVYNQEVFTTENSRRFETVALRRLLRLIGIEPYYTFNTKGKEETRKYRVPIARLLQEQKEEARLTPGVERTDKPIFNVPRLGKVNLNAWQDHEVIMIMPNGSRVYEFHPWEKNISLANTYIYTDVPIYDYLKELERRGENLEDYKTIWYYF
ncbi:KamA family radical SAM protein [Methanotorris igneus]|uniref:Lysine 2,3-aminomutase YodO family protein n=1 Tax=Methanotorris igneus (strain DSM 5666 / JCM 11834 / Kol 5) TaxID=880724 RepID=F6BB84_METIK|nr:KamA family radical SAM protein [Methanotorris igneus]AEF95969.1 lysine 2,3-aminomutase YodO family protein [Methanotorris igneus Kol 5]